MLKYRIEIQKKGEVSKNILEAPTGKMVEMVNKGRAFCKEHKVGWSSVKVWERVTDEPKKTKKDA